MIKQSGTCIFISCWNYSLSWKSVDLMRGNSHLSIQKYEEAMIECFGRLLWCKWLYQVRLTIVHCYGVQNNKLFHSKKIDRARAQKNRNMTIFNWFLSKHTTLFEVLLENKHGVRKLHLPDAFIMKIRSNKRTPMVFWAIEEIVFKEWFILTAITLYPRRFSF